MPASVVHAYFSQDVYDILPANIKKKVNIRKLKMFSQGTEPLRFYNLFRPLPGKQIRKFNEYFHNNDSQKFFINTIDYIKENHLYKDEDVCSFLIGFICHYVLDSNIHPYIYYRTGVFNKKIPPTYKYNNVHLFMETFLDNDMILRREKTNPYTFKAHKFCYCKDKFSHNLTNTINYSFSKTFNKNNMEKIYYSSLKQARRISCIFRRDPIGIKKFCYKLLDTFTSKKTFRFEAISYHYPLDDRHDFLNSSNKLWRNPTTYDMTSTESFLDLYIKSIKLSKALVCSTFDYINGKDVNLNKIFLNNSYITGLDCKLQKELKYFDF